MIAFKDLFTIQYACHDGIDFKKKIFNIFEISCNIFWKRKLIKSLNVRTFTKSLYKIKLIKDQNIYIGIVMLDLL